MISHQDLPKDWAERELLRDRGQFWTPDWVAEPMVRYALSGDADSLFDPAVGPGTFLLAAQRLEQRGTIQGVNLYGRDVDPDVVRQAFDAGLRPSASIDLLDFVESPPPPRSLHAIVANPPYIRHHRIGYERKLMLRAEVEHEHGIRLDGRVGFHYYFFLAALRSLSPGGRLCFIMSADTAEGISAKKMWSELVTEFRLDAVVTFTPEATPFPGVDTNAIIYCISRRVPQDDFAWIEVSQPTDALGDVLEGIGRSTFRGDAVRDVHVFRRSLEEAVETGLSRPVFTDDIAARLGDYVRVMRGIVAGDSDFFLLDDEAVASRSLPQESLTPIVVRTRDVLSEAFSHEDFEQLGVLGRPRWLFCGEGQKGGDDPVSEYVREGERRGLPNKPILAARGKRWYRSERREVPDFFFAYLGRRRQRFIANHAKVVPSTAFLCVYIRPEWMHKTEAITSLLGDESVIANLRFVGKSYGGGAIKVEPRSLEKLPLTRKQLDDAGLSSSVQQLQIL